MSKIKVIAFDADDTLWENENYFRDAENEFAAILEDFAPHHTITQELYKTEMDNLELYGYGIKSFMLSMIETATRVTQGRAGCDMIDRIISIGRRQLTRPVILMPQVDEVLQKVGRNYRLVLATKGDLLDQERKLEQSGLALHFHHIEIMSHKKVSDYKKLLGHLDIEAAQFMMIGNSLASDALPVLDLGGYAIHIPYHTTWEHERIQTNIDSSRFFQVEKIKEVLEVIAGM